MTDLLETLRAINVALTFFAAAGLGMRLNDDWRHLTRPRRVIYTGGVLFPVVGAYGSAEAYLQGAPVGVRTPLVTLACAVVLAGLAWHHYRPSATRDR